MADISSTLIERMLNGFAQDFPEHTPGTRPIHSKGIGAIGWFRGSDVAERYSSAVHFEPNWIPVRVRFSNGNGQHDADGLRQVRGMAIRFYPNGTIVDGEIVADDSERPLLRTDLVCMSVETFMIDEPADLLAVQKALVPKRVKSPGLLRQLRALLAMSPIPPEDTGVTTSPNAGILAWQKRYPKGRSFVLSNSLLPPPDSYARTAYHAVHAFDMVDASGVHRMVRFAVEPGDGVHSSAPVDDDTNSYGAGLAPDYLQSELRDRLGRESCTFALRMQVADPWDDTADPTVAWPRHRQRVLMGTMVLHGVADDQQRHCEQLSFNPGRLLPGMGLSDDPVLHARLAVYEASQMRRGAEQCPVVHH